MSSGQGYFRVPGTGLGSYMDYVITIRWCGCDIYNGDEWLGDFTNDTH